MSTVPPLPEPGAPKEPLRAVGTLVALATAILAVTTAFGLNLSPDQTAAILGLLAAAAPIVVAIWARRTVWSPASVRRITKLALDEANVPAAQARQIVDKLATP